MISKFNLENNINQKVEEILSDLRFLEFNKKDKYKTEDYKPAKHEYIE